MNNSTFLTTREWRIVHKLAKSLANYVDPNEFGKVVTYMQRAKDSKRLIELLDRLPRSNFVYSDQTSEYQSQIATAYRRYLESLDPERALLVAHWVFRLTKYYR